MSIVTNTQIHAVNACKNYNTHFIQKYIAGIPINSNWFYLLLSQNEQYNYSFLLMVYYVNGGISS